MTDHTAIARYDLTSDVEEIWPEVARHLHSIASNGDFILGDLVGSFERAFAAFQRVEHVVGVGSGTDALEFSLRAVGVGPGDEVIIPANTFYATAAAVLRICAKPIVVDCDETYLLMDPDALATAIGRRTAAVLPVHMYGQMAPMDPILRIADASGIPVVEDCAQSHGSSQDGWPAGARGRASGTSFHPHKNLAAWGDAGAVLTNDRDVAARVRRLRMFGADERRVHVDAGWNSRLDTVQAAVLTARLGRLEAGNVSRAAVAARYEAQLGGTPHLALPQIAPGNESTWHLYVVRLPNRPAVARRMQAMGVGVSVDYAVPIHLHPGLEALGYVPGDFPIAEAAASGILSLPIYPSLDEQQQDRVCATLLEAMS